ncbi:cation:proton antiporter [Streptomyces sp. RTGN2]|uniref:cation:proton antiporter domain-containing protein n=1 Tax=Streptomyces sp. RTGN2 TaxID=3016525 RepID=UPI0025578B4B|nr:cation:proton antiporter [Streptomyces sp. RTGN2]
MTLSSARPMRAAPARSRRPAVSMAAGLVVLVSATVVWGPGLVRGGGEHSGADPTARFLLAVAVIVLLSHLLGTVFRRFGQPAVIGEIVGGLLLGPSALGWVWPSAQAWLLPAEVKSTISMAAQLGLVTFMFLLGCELRMERVRAGSSALAATVLGGMGLPFLAGLGIAVAAPDVLRGSAGHHTSYALFFGLALSVTALPVLARVLVDLRMDRSELGTFALAGAAVGDGVAWLALTVILAMTSATGSVAATVGLTLALVTVTALAVRPLRAAAVLTAEKRQGGAKLLLPMMLLAGAVTYAAITQVIGLHPVIGAFLFGTAVPRGSRAAQRMNEQLQGFTLAVLLPLFFAGVGLNVSVRGLGLDPWHWLVLVGVVAAATVSKFAGAGGAAMAVGMPRNEALRLGALMNCRGVTEVVVAGIGWEAGLISSNGLTVLVLMALATTALTGPLLKAIGVRPPAASGAVASPGPADPDPVTVNSVRIPSPSAQRAPHTLEV